MVSVTLCLRGPGHTSVPEIRRTLAVFSISYEEAMHRWQSHSLPHREDIYKEEENSTSKIVYKTVKASEP